MVFHTLVELVATILITLIASGSFIGWVFLSRHYKLRTEELEAQLDARDAQARLAALEAQLGAVEARLGAMEGAIGTLAASLAPPPLETAPSAAGAGENRLPSRSA
jgi:hypothetical protein